MKKRIIRIFLVTFIAQTLLTGCTGHIMNNAGTAPPAQESQDVQPVKAPETTEWEQQMFFFKAYGQNIFVSSEAKPILMRLPEPRDIFEAPSCAFAGLDITYFYPGFELTTYTENDMEYVLSVVFIDDSITTPEGVYLGGTTKNMEKAYGKDYSQSDGQFSYIRGKGRLIFTFEDDIIVGIMYVLIL